ncbi:type I-F CRISPR-associated protein Csy2 [Aeromonas hydrophila]
MHLQDLLDIVDHGERDRQLRRHFAPYSADMDVDGLEEVALVVLLNLTLKRDRVESLCDESHARLLLGDESHMANCLKTVRWLHTHNLKYPDTRVSGQRLIIDSPPLFLGVITSAGLPMKMGWAHDSSDINLAKLYSTSFRYQGASTNLALQLIARSTVWEQALTGLGLTQQQLDIWCQQLANHLESNILPTEVSPFSKQVRFSYRGHYCSVTPVVSHTLLARLQNGINENKLHFTHIHHDHPASVGGLVGALGGKVAVLDYPPPVGPDKTRSFLQTRLQRLADGQSLFDRSIFNDNTLIDALNNLISRPGLTRKQQRQLRLSALRYLRRQLTIWLGPIIELRDEIENTGHGLPSGLSTESVEYGLITKPQKKLPDLMLQVTGRLHIELQNHPGGRRYAFHPELMAPFKSQILWLLRQLTDDVQKEEPHLPTSCCYLHLSGLTVYDASALANPYLCGIPSLSALAGFCHDFERRTRSLITQPIHFGGIAWFLSHYSRIAGKHLPEPSKLANPSTVSAVRRPGVLDGRYCDLTMDLVIEIHIPPDGSQSFAACIDLLRAALPARFAGGTLHPPSLYEERNWCTVYQEKSELFTVLSRLPRYGCWIYPSDDDSLSVERLGEALVLDCRLRPVATGFVFLEEPVERRGSIESLHVYAESTIGTALCINPVEMRLAGQRKFFSTGFWQLSDVDGAILMNGQAILG